MILQNEGNSSFERQKLKDYKNQWIYFTKNVLKLSQKLNKMCPISSNPHILLIFRSILWSRTNEVGEICVVYNEWAGAIQMR